MLKLLIDLFGTGLGIFVAFMLFETFWERKKVKRRVFAIGIILIATTSIALTVMLQNTLILPLLVIALIFIMSYYFISSITYKIILSFAIVAIMFIAEIALGQVLKQLFQIPIEQAQANMALYVFGVLSSKLIALFLVYVIRVVTNGNKQESNRQFNILIAFMPIQSIILCYIVIVYSFGINTYDNTMLVIAAVVLSVLLIFITMIILENQRKALVYKKEYELGQIRLKMQIEHYQKIYQEQQIIKSIRHEINNNMIAITGMLNAGQVQETIDWISELQKQVVSTADIVNTGNPPIDAILSAKINKAKESDVCITYTVKIDDELYIDQFDIAVIIANALDNAIEGTQRSDDIDRTITLIISRKADYISILVENYASGPIYEDFRTSKQDKQDHGFGLEQMREVTEKYSGSFRPSYDSTTRRFSLKVLLKNQKI